MASDTTGTLDAATVQRLDAQARVRSMALVLRAGDGSEWRMAMNSFPFFGAASVETRLDTGVRAGDEVSGAFDSMLAKLIVTGATREQALERSRRALAELTIEGMPTAATFHEVVVSDPAFAPADGEPFSVHTRWIETEFDNDIPAWDGEAGPAAEPEARHTVVVEVSHRCLETLIDADGDAHLLAELIRQCLRHGFAQRPLEHPLRLIEGHGQQHVVTEQPDEARQVEVGAITRADAVLVHVLQRGVPGALVVDGFVGGHVAPPGAAGVAAGRSSVLEAVMATRRAWRLPIVGPISTELSTACARCVVGLIGRCAPDEGNVVFSSG